MVLGMERSKWEGKYLGLPYLIGRSKKQIFLYIKDRV